MNKNSHSTHILIVSSGLNIAGGLERMVVSLANLLAESGYQISILVIGTTKESFYPIHHNIYVYQLNANFGINSHVNYSKRKIDFVTDIIKLRKEIINIHPHIVITTEYTFTVAAIFGGLHTIFKIICWQHNTFNTKKSFLWDKASKFAYKKVAYIAALNKDEQKHYQKYNQRTIVIPNFIQQVATSATLETRQILTIARFDIAKGIDLLLNAAAIIVNKYPEWKWKLIGKGNLEKEYSSDLLKYGMPENIIQQQPSSKVDEEYMQSSIYVMTSRKELFPMVLLEAMSHGLPCIAFDCETGPRHIITNNVDGILVEKESPEKLAEAISLLIEDKEKRSRMGKAAFENVQRFSSEIILKKWEELFNKLLQP